MQKVWWHFWREGLKFENHGDNKSLNICKTHISKVLSSCRMGSWCAGFHLSHSLKLSCSKNRERSWGRTDDDSSQKRSLESKASTIVKAVIFLYDCLVNSVEFGVWKHESQNLFNARCAGLGLWAHSCKRHDHPRAIVLQNHLSCVHWQFGWR